jgi:hypothetical protein
LVWANPLHFGTKVKSVFTTPRTRRYATVMLVLAAAAAIAASPQFGPSARVSASAEAQATIRIISGTVLRLGEGPTVGDAPAAQLTVAHTDGATVPAKLIEFE